VFGHKIPGFAIDVGQTAVLELDLFSDAPTDGPWTVRAEDITDLDPGSPSFLDLSLDRTAGRNGEKLHLTVTVKPGAFVFENIRLTSTLGSASHTWFAKVQTRPMLH
jgi:hypothetical protein